MNFILFKYAKICNKNITKYTMNLRIFSRLPLSEKELSYNFKTN